MHGMEHAWWRACMAGVCMVGACMVEGMHGRGVHGRGMHGRGHAWQGACVTGGMCGKGICMVGGVHGRGHVWHACPWQILRDMVNEWVVCILLECILVYFNLVLFYVNMLKHVQLVNLIKRRLKYSQLTCKNSR